MRENNTFGVKTLSVISNILYRVKLDTYQFIQVKIKSLKRIVKQIKNKRLYICLN